MKEDLITIVVPVYNVEKYLKKCIESVINQTYKNLEIILVDDGSTDKSGNICDEYEKKDSRIKVIHKENGGLSDARNKGIDIAKGKYISFVDSDDFIAIDFIEYLYNMLLNNCADIAICDFCLYYEKGKDYEIEESEKIKVYSKLEAIEALINDLEIHNYAWNKLYKKSLFNEIRYPFGKKMEDLGTTYLLFDESNKIVSSNLCKYYYFQRDDSIVNNIRDPRLFIDRFELLTERYNFLNEKYNELMCNDLIMIKNCIGLYRIKNKDVLKFAESQNLKEKVKKVIGKNKNVIKKMSKKDKIKLLIFFINPKFLNI